MKIKIDFDNKEIEVLDSTPLGELVDKLKEMKLDWKEFKLKAGVEYINYPWTTYVPYIPLPQPQVIYITPPIQVEPSWGTPYNPPYKITCSAIN